MLKKKKQKPFLDLGVEGFFPFMKVEIGYKSEKKKVFIDDTQLAIPVSTGQYICVTISSSMVT